MDKDEIMNRKVILLQRYRVLVWKLSRNHYTGLDNHFPKDMIRVWYKELHDLEIELIDLNTLHKELK